MSEDKRVVCIKCKWYRKNKVGFFNVHRITEHECTSPAFIDFVTGEVARGACSALARNHYGKCEEFKGAKE